MWVLGEILTNPLNTWKKIYETDELLNKPPRGHLPKWVEEGLGRDPRSMQKGAVFYYKGRPYVYKIMVLPARVQGYEKIVVYRKRRRLRC